MLDYEVRSTRDFECRMDYSLLNDIKEYICDEFKDSLYYEILASKAPTQRARELLMEFSRDEKLLAENFMKAYRIITGTEYKPESVNEPEVPEYNEALKDCLINESSDYRKYGVLYLNAANKCLKELFFMARTTEVQHAMRLPVLIYEQLELLLNKIGI